MFEAIKGPACFTEAGRVLARLSAVTPKRRSLMDRDFQLTSGPTPRLPTHMLSVCKVFGGPGPAHTCPHPLVCPISRLLSATCTYHTPASCCFWVHFPSPGINGNLLCCFQHWLDKPQFFWECQPSWQGYWAGPPASTQMALSPLPVLPFLLKLEFTGVLETVTLWLLDTAPFLLLMSHWWLQCQVHFWELLHPPGQT